jgi:exodeoxyribonuclease VII small subunit
MTTKKTTYREAYSELESILEKLENNELDVDQLAEQVKRAAELIKFCRRKLVETETEIEKVMEQMDSEGEE